MIAVQPIVLEDRGIRLEPLAPEHLEPLISAADDGQLWELWYAAIPGPPDMAAYIEAALQAQTSGSQVAWVVRDMLSNTIIGATRYHDIVPALDRVEIGYTWYAQSRQRTGVNTTCKLMLLRHAFETIGCQVVGLRTDGFNFRSQRAIEALGAKKDGVIRHFGIRKDGTARDSVMYSILAREWPDVRRHLELRLARHVG